MTRDPEPSAVSAGVGRPPTIAGAAFGAVLACVLALAIASGPNARVTGKTTTGGGPRPPTRTADSGLAPDRPATAFLPGPAPHLPWPSTGEATVHVDGVGRLGATPDQHPLPIASIAKVMTAYLVLRDHPMNAGDDGAKLTVTKAEAAAYTSEAGNNESLVKVTAGEVLTERQALEALLLPSADNMARILARWDAGTIPAFAGKMNAAAATLGMTATHYTDPSGYDPATRSTASDQVLLATQAMRLPAFAEIVAMPTATIPVEGTVRSYNSLLGADGIVGIKTGSTSWAGGCLLFAAHRQVGGRTATIAGAVLGQHGSTMHGLPQALSAGAQLIKATADALGTYIAIRAGQKVSTIAGTNLVAARDITVVGWPGLAYRLTLRVTRATVRPGPQRGTRIGRLELDTAEGRETTGIVAG